MLARFPRQHLVLQQQLRQYNAWLAFYDLEAGH